MNKWCEICDKDMRSERRNKRKRRCKGCRKEHGTTMGMMYKKNKLVIER